MTIPIVKADLEARLGVAEVARFSMGVIEDVANDANVDLAIAQAWDSARSAGLNVFTAASWDALTPSTLPPEAKLHIVSHACSILAAGSTSNPSLEKWAEEAAKWRGYLAGGKVWSFDGVLERIEALEDSVSWQSPDRKFDRSTNDYYSAGGPRRS